MLRKLFSEIQYLNWTYYISLHKGLYKPFAIHIIILEFYYVLVLTRAEKTTSFWLRTQIWVKKVSQFHRKIWPKRQKRTTVFFFSCLFFASLAKKNHQGYHLTPLTMSSIQSHCIQVFQWAIYFYYIFTTSFMPHLLI